MRITMRSSNLLLDRFDYLKELVGLEQSRSNIFASACRLALDKVQKNGDIFVRAQKLQVKSYRREALPENIKLDIDDVLYQEIRNAVQEYFHLERVQNPFLCKLVLGIYIMSLEGHFQETDSVTGSVEVAPVSNEKESLFGSDLERLEVFLQMLKGDRAYVEQIDRLLKKWKNEQEL